MTTQSPRYSTIQRQKRSLSDLLQNAEDILLEIAQHPHYLRMLADGYSPDLNISDAQTAIAYLQDELV